MLKILVIAIAILIAAVNGVAQTTTRRNTPRKAAVVRVGPTTTYLKEGLSTEQVVRLLGEPSAILERQEESSTVLTYEFPRAEGRVLIAEFVNDALRSSRVEARGELARSNG